MLKHLIDKVRRLFKSKNTFKYCHHTYNGEIATEDLTKEQIDRLYQERFKGMKERDAYLKTHIGKCHWED